MLERRVQSFQRVNKQLREQLGASKLLLERLRSGPETVKAGILEYLAADEYPDDIVRQLNEKNPLQPLNPLELRTESRSERGV